MLFARGMRTARGGAADPSLAQDEETGYSTEREQVVPFFDFEPELLYPLLDHEGINQVTSANAPLRWHQRGGWARSLRGCGRRGQIFDAVMGPGWILTLTEGIIHAGGTGWVCLPQPPPRSVDPAQLTRRFARSTTTRWRRKGCSACGPRFTSTT